jgi:c-di-GMP-binding flagellar brake protein YcgR
MKRETPADKPTGSGLFTSPEPTGPHAVHPDSQPDKVPTPEPGTRVRILTAVDDGDGIAARVIEVEGERVVLRLSPGAGDEGQFLLAGVEVQLLLGRRDAAYLYQAAVLAAPQENLVAVLLCGHPLRVQRREYFRLAVRLPIGVRLRPEPAERPPVDGEYPGVAAAVPGETGAGTENEPTPSVTLQVFRLADLSGGGCLCLDPDNQLHRGRLYTASLELHDGEPPLAVRVEVVRKGVSFGYPSAGLRFVAMVEKQRERVMRTLFREYRQRSPRNTE